LLLVAVVVADMVVEEVLEDLELVPLWQLPLERITPLLLVRAEVRLRMAQIKAEMATILYLAPLHLQAAVVAAG